MSGMSIWEILLLGVGLSMDAFAVSICKGLSVKKVKWQHLLCVGAYFGIFQALMPTLGYFLGTTFSNLIDQFDHWVAFILLAIIGVNMVREALSKDEDETNDDFGFKTMLLLAIATSIDALAVGVTFALEGTDIALAACLIGLTTFTLSPIGLLVGHRFGLRAGALRALAHQRNRRRPHGNRLPRDGARFRNDGGRRAEHLFR